MSIFNILHESNQNIMEYGSPPMQPAMAFPTVMPMYSMTKPHASSEKKEKEKKDEDSDGLLKVLALAGLLGGGALAIHHVTKPNAVQDAASKTSDKVVDTAKAHIGLGLKLVHNNIKEYSKHVDKLPDDQIEKHVIGYSDYLQNDTMLKYLDAFGPSGSNVKKFIGDFISNATMNKHHPARQASMMLHDLNGDNNG